MQDGLCTIARGERSRQALDFVHGLLAESGQASLSLDAVLSGLAQALGATGAGAATLPEGTVLARSSRGQAGSPRLWPWQARPELVIEAGNAPRALSVPFGPEGTILLAAGAQPHGLNYLIWVETAVEREWTAEERATLVLAAQTLGRWVAEGPSATSWAGRTAQAARRHRMEDAAHVTRRVSHDIGNLLTGILGFTELAMAHIDANSPATAFMKELYQAVQQSIRVTSHLRLFSRRTTGPVTPSSLVPALAEEETRFRQEPGAGSLALAVEAAPDLPLVALNTEALRTVLGNLLDNAREAVQGPGTITLTARLVQLTEAGCLDLLGCAMPGPHVEVTVIDDGSGLSAEARQRLFAEPFFTDKPRHRGLGLAVAYGILCAHKGGLSVDPGPKHGTVARALLPIAAASAPVDPARVYKPRVTRGERVLVVDDDPMILKFCSATLEQAGYRVQTAANAADALESYLAASVEPFRLVVSDVVMPRMSGVDLARRLRAQDAGVGVLFMSGQVVPNCKEELVGGPCDFLPKPFRPEGLLDAVRTALDRASHRVPARAGGPG